MRKKVLSIILILIIVFYSCKVFAVSSEYVDAANKKQEASNQLDSVQATKSKALQEIQSLQDSIDKVESEIAALDTKINNLTASINEKSKQIEEKEKEYEKNEEILKQRMVVLYEAGQTSYLEVLLTSKSITDFISKYYIMSEIAEADSEVLNEIETTKKEIEETKANLEEEKKQVDEAKSEKTEKNKELIASKNEKQTKVNSLTEEEKQLQSEIEEYDSTMKKIAELERKAAEQAAQAQAKAKAASSASTTKNASTSSNASSSATAATSAVTSSATAVSGTGQLAWPIPGYTSITSYYGYRIHPIYGVYKLHNGIDVGAPAGASFVAADDGTVILAEYYGGYGNCVVINHGNGMCTRYAHGTSILVKAGQKVTRGTPVLTVGSTGTSTGNHAHFEVSINGNTVNPLNYL